MKPALRPGGLPHDDIRRAVLYMAYAMALIPLLNASAKYLSRDYAIPEIVRAHYAIFGEFPDLWTWIGALIIVVSGIYMIYGEK
jgi:drug/metabolite transporter (DMT)-like permease